MGFPVEQFVASKINEEFLCSICHDVLQETTMANPCEHTFCGKCIRDWQEQGNSDTCPIDREVINELRRPPRPFLSMLNALEIRCPFQEAGCGISVQLGDYVLHSELCEANPENRITCAGGCGAVLKKSNVKDHNCVAYLMGLIGQMKVTASTVQEQLLRANAKLLAELQTTREELQVTRDAHVEAELGGCAEQQNTAISSFGESNGPIFSTKPKTTDSIVRNPETDLLSLGTSIKFKPFVGADILKHNDPNGLPRTIAVKYQCIAIMMNYNESKCLEELRWEDYQLGRINSAWLRLRLQEPATSSLE